MVHSVKVPEELSYLKTREVLVKSKAFTVPQGIVRIDIDNGKVGTHGWQVRPRKFLANQKSKFFSDRVEGVHVGPAQSLANAMAYMVQNRPPVQVKQYPTMPLCGAGVATGFPGIRLIVRNRANRNFKEVYVEASNLVRKKASKRFYCGTLETATEDRVALAISRALQARQTMAQELLAIRQAEQAEALERALKRDLKRWNQKKQFSQ